MEGHDYLDKSIQLSQRSKVIAPQRGEIYDRYNDTPLAINIDSFAIDMIPGEIPVGQYDTVAVKLANFLDIPKSEIDKKQKDVNNLQLETKSLTERVAVAGKIEALVDKKDRYEKLSAKKQALTENKIFAEQIFNGKTVL